MIVDTSLASLRSRAAPLGIIIHFLCPLGQIPLTCLFSPLVAIKTDHSAPHARSLRKCFTSSDSRTFTTMLSLVRGMECLGRLYLFSLSLLCIFLMLACSLLHSHFTLLPFTSLFFSSYILSLVAIFLPFLRLLFHNHHHPFLVHRTK